MDPFAGILALDFETSSACPIKLGAWAYSLHESTRVYCAVFCYSTGPKDPKRYVVWEPGCILPQEIVDYVEAGGTILAHNNAFERAIWSNQCEEYFGWPTVELDQWRDTQAAGQAMNLPRSLEGLGAALGCAVQKDKVGAALMLKMAKAVPDGDSWAYPLATRENLDRLIEYCCLDVGATLDAHWMLPALSVAEAQVWAVDQGINARGMYLDRVFADKCATLVEARKKELSDDVFDMTAGELVNSTAPPALKAWLKAKGVELPKARRKKADGTYHMTETTDKAAVAKILEDPELKGEVRRLLENRTEANKATSLAKLARVATMVGADGRLRNSLQYCAAGTGRWASYGLQVHNLPKDKLGKEGGALVRRMIELESLDGLKLVVDRPLEGISQCLRSVIAAPPGKDLIAGDYSAVEARVLAWIAGQGNIVDIFREYDRELRAGNKIQDVYEYTAAKIGSSDRQLGKVCVLALGYGMGALKFHSTAADWGSPIGLKDAYRIQRAWREANGSIVSFWHELDNAVRDAIDDKGKAYRVGPLVIKSNGICLAIRLPSGRSLRYWRPKVVPTVKEIQVVTEDGTIETREMRTQEIRFYSVGKGGKMAPDSTYGGKLAENITQAIARDLLAEAVVRIDKHEPFELVVHVHDSACAEVPEGEGRISVFCELMEASPAWAPDMPISVEGYRAKRFCG